MSGSSKPLSGDWKAAYVEAYRRANGAGCEIVRHGSRYRVQPDAAELKTGCSYTRDELADMTRRLLARPAHAPDAPASKRRKP